MTVEVTGTTIDVLGKTYQLKCSENDVEMLRKAAALVEQKMQEARNRAHVFSADRLAVMAALDMAHQLITIEKEKNDYVQSMTEGLRDLQNKIENFFALNAQMEF